MTNLESVPFTWTGPKLRSIRLHADLVVRDVVVPSGFVSDGASVPRWLQGLVPKYGRYTAAAIVHDFLYSERQGARADADRLFLSVMVEDRTRVLRALLMWSVVRCFGWIHWRQS